MKTSACGRRSRAFFSAQPRAVVLFQQQWINNSALLREWRRAYLIQKSLSAEDAFRSIPKSSSPLTMLRRDGPRPSFPAHARCAPLLSLFALAFMSH
jgi:hypothetical protein